MEKLKLAKEGKIIFLKDNLKGIYKKRAEEI